MIQSTEPSFKVKFSNQDWPTKAEIDAVVNPTHTATAWCFGTPEQWRQFFMTGSSEAGPPSNMVDENYRIPENELKKREL